MSSATVWTDSISRHFLSMMETVHIVYEEIRMFYNFEDEEAESKFFNYTNTISKA